MKFFGIGLPKTGTTTLGHCFLAAGLSKAPYDGPFIEEIANGDLSSLKETIEGYDSFEDWPWPLLYRQIDDTTPEVRFVLTLRRDADTWLHSVQEHTKRSRAPRSKEFRRKLFGFENPWKNAEEYRDFYENHSRQAVHFFRNHPTKLLVICWENGDGWEELAPFLGLSSMPHVPIPHLNSSKQRWTPDFGQVARVDPES